MVWAGRFDGLRRMVRSRGRGPWTGLSVVFGTGVFPRWDWPRVLLCRNRVKAKRRCFGGVSATSRSPSWPWCPSWAIPNFDVAPCEHRACRPPLRGMDGFRPGRGEAHEEQGQPVRQSPSPPASGKRRRRKWKCRLPVDRKPAWDRGFVASAWNQRRRKAEAITSRPNDPASRGRLPVASGTVDTVTSNDPVLFAQP